MSMNDRRIVSFQFQPLSGYVCIATMPLAIAGEPWRPPNVDALPVLGFRQEHVEWHHENGDLASIVCTETVVMLDHFGACDVSDLSNYDYEEYPRIVPAAEAAMAALNAYKHAVESHKRVEEAKS